MTEETANTTPETFSETPGLNRHELGKRGAMLGAAAGAAWAAPVVFDSFASPAAAATCPNNTSPQSLSGPGTKEVCIPSGKTVTYTIIGGGGGGGGVNTHNGGSATKMTGSFTTAGPVRLTLVGAGGGAGGQREVDGGVGGTGGAGYRTPSVLPKPLRRCR